MLYSTLVDKSEATMNLLIARAEEFDQDRVLDGLDTRHYSVMEVRKMTAFVTDHLSRGRHAGLTDVESLLWNNDLELVARVRQAIAHFDEVEPAGLHDRATGRQKLSSVHVAMLMQWCRITGTGKEKQFVEEYFNKTYQGRYQPVGSSAVNAAKTRITPAAYTSFAARLDTLCATDPAAHL